jgi:hypothetical protein
MAMLHIVDKFYGDKRLIWRADDKESKAKAIEEFKERLKKGWLAFKLNPEDPHKGEMLREFDESAEKIVMTPPVAAG